MDTQEKFGLKKSHAILLFIQMLIIILGTIITGFVFTFIVSSGYGGIMLASSVSVLISYVVIILYGSFGYSKDDAYYLVAIGFFAFAVVINTMIDFRTPFQIGILTVLFGSIVAFAVKQDNKKLSLYFALVAFFLALVFSIYSAITAGYTKGDFKEVHVMISSGEIGTPCFVCRQMISELFDLDSLVRCYSTHGNYKDYTVEELCPYPFGEDDLQ